MDEEVLQLLPIEPKLIYCLEKTFADEVKEIIYSRGTGEEFARLLCIPKQTLYGNMIKGRWPSSRIAKVCEILSINWKRVQEAVTHVYYWGSHNPDQNIKVNWNFDRITAQAVGLYIAEGTTGLNGNKQPTKIRLSNSNRDVVTFFLKWCMQTFPNKVPTIQHILATGEKKSKPWNNAKNVYRLGNYNKINKYNVCIDSKLHYLIFDVYSAKVLEKLLENNDELASGFLEGLFAGEGTVYHGNSLYVRLEMKQSPITTLAEKALHKLKIPFNTSLRRDRPSMRVIYIGAQTLPLFASKVGFGCHKERQNKLELAVMESKRRATKKGQ